MTDTIQNRSELLFLYDVKYANPNGDPMDLNRPRLDEDSMKCLVTDVRLKRTIRDYLDNSLADEARKGNEIFIKEIIKEDGSTASVKDRIKQVAKIAAKSDLDNIRKFIIDNFIDTRLFGATYPVELKGNKDSITLTGPVQFNIGSSLNKVKEVPFDLSFVMASGEGKKTGSQAEGGKKTIKYGLIGFHGVINEVAAKHTGLNDNDVKLLTQGMWYGTKELLTTSKKGHMPRLLIKIDYQPGFYVGDLIESLSLEIKGEKEAEQLEDVTDYVLQTKALNEVLQKHENKIITVGVKQDDRLELSQPIFKATGLSIE